ncbi:hypothetical protein P280DRAFT_391489 [Massarina eburnea CBS 473.64]|uniref:F-box domain-containing protein n=1 Tax=Massarina eburnea CBS 473.64 TaxID=1395130 RepID=A0A6A6SF71_9PLEO|nr:hypothetical protein P280DRAFT_391489 [Massarina eburnea CBS 473.64]
MGDADLIRSFRALQNSESRKEALGALLRELSPYEWRFTHHLLAQRSWCCDIVASLPLELVAHIFSHVDTAAPFRLQQVSTRWRTILRSLDVLKPNLNAWYDDTSHLEAFDYGQCRKRAEDAHRFRSGKYAKLSSVPVETLPLESILVEDTLVSRCPSYRSILVENLRTGESWKGQGSARELITYTAASEEIVAFTTSSSTCYVTNVAGEQKRKFKLHGSMFKTAPVCSGRTIICAGFSENYAEIYMWNFDTQKGSSFRIGRDQPLFASHNNE